MSDTIFKNRLDISQININDECYNDIFNISDTNDKHITKTCNIDNCDSILLHGDFLHKYDKECFNEFYYINNGRICSPDIITEYSLVFCKLIDNTYVCLVSIKNIKENSIIPDNRCTIIYYAKDFVKFLGYNEVKETIKIINSIPKVEQVQIFTDII
jgi:hypothetical protein